MPTDSLRRTDRLALVGALLVALAFLAAGDVVKWPLEDVAEYWAAGRLALEGGNPYDRAAILAEQRTIDPTLPDAIVMYNPPWTLPIAVLFGFGSFSVARAFWLSLQLVVTLWCAARLWALYGGEPRHAIRAGALALLWMPTIVALRFGQWSPLILLGLVGFLWNLRRGRELAAGIALGLTAVKPQLVALVWVAFFCWVLIGKRWRSLSGFALAIAGLTLAAVAIDPEAFRQYSQLMTSYRPTFTFESPNVATMLRIAFGGTSDWPQYIPTAAGAALVAYLWFRRKSECQWELEMRWLVVATCFATAYGGWAFDLIVLLIPILAAAAQLVRIGGYRLKAGAAGFCVISGIALALHQAQAPQATFVWMVPSVAIGLYAVGAFGTGFPEVAWGWSAEKQDRRNRPQREGEPRGDSEVFPKRRPGFL